MTINSTIDKLVKTIKSLEKERDSIVENLPDHASVEGLRNYSSWTKVIKESEQLLSSKRPGSRIEPSVQSFHLDQPRNMEPQPAQSQGFVSDSQDFLTQQVWPRTRILLAIISRMHKENILSYN